MTEMVAGLLAVWPIWARCFVQTAPFASSWWYRGKIESLTISAAWRLGMRLTMTDGKSIRDSDAGTPINTLVEISLGKTLCILLGISLSRRLKGHPSLLERSIDGLQYRTSSSVSFLFREGIVFQTPVQLDVEGLVSMKFSRSGVSLLHTQLSMRISDFVVVDQLHHF